VYLPIFNCYSESHTCQKTCFPVLDWFEINLILNLKKDEEFLFRKNKEKNRLLSINPANRKKSKRIVFVFLQKPQSPFLQLKFKNRKKFNSKTIVSCSSK